MKCEYSSDDPTVHVQVLLMETNRQMNMQIDRQTNGQTNDPNIKCPTQFRSED